jgi:hypothetical protein
VCLLVAIVRTRDEQDVFFASVAYLPGIIALALLPLSGSLELWWYVPYCSPLIVAAAGRGLSRTGLAPQAVVGILCAGTLALLPSVITYYSTSQKDSDVRPIVAYLLAHAKHGVDATDPVYLFPTYIEFKLSYYSGDAISYLAVPRGTDLGALGDEPSSAGHDVWLVVDMHAKTKLADLDRDPRLQPVNVTGSNPKRVRLFHLDAP